MNVAALKTTAKTLILICFTVFVDLPLLFSCAFVIQDWRYTRFCWRSQSYHARIADACDLLVAQAEPVEREVHHPILQSLPGVLRDLGPDYVSQDQQELRVGAVGERGDRLGSRPI